MHGVGAQQEEFGASGLNTLGRLSEQLPGLLPLSGDLQAFDVCEVDEDEYEPGGVQTAEPVTHQLIGQPVVLGAGLPTHPTRQADHSGPAGPRHLGSMS